MSLRTRLFMSYVVIIVLCLAIVTLSVTLLLQGYRDRLAMERLDNVARPVAAQLRSLIQGEVSSSELLGNMAEQAQSNSVYIILGGSDGNIVRQIPPEPGPQQQLLELAAGELPHNIRKATQGTFVTIGGRTFIYAAYPIGRVSGLGEQTRIQTLVIATSRSGTFAIWASLLRPLLLAGLIALAISLIVAILLARSLHRPIKQMTDIVMEMSEGRYDVQIPIAGSKEMKRLAQGLNQMANQIKRSQLQLRHFVADASHQLKSPLTSIQGFAQAMLDGTASDDEACSDLAFKAAKKIFDEGEVSEEDIGLLILCTQNPDYKLPHTSAILQQRLNLRNCIPAFDLNLGCSGFVYSLAVAKGFMEAHDIKYALVITSDPYSKIVSPGDRNTVSLFGDAAAATLLKEDGFMKIMKFTFGTDGAGFTDLIVYTGGSRNPFKLREGLGDEKNLPFLSMNSRAIFNFMMTRVPANILECLKLNQIGIDEVDFFVFHQASKYMIEALGKKMDIDSDKVVLDLRNTGNTVSSSIPIALAPHVRSKDTGNKIYLICGFGVGLSWASSILKVHEA